MPSGCSWTAVSNANWITITSGGSGNANGTVNYQVASTTSARSGTITIGGQNFTATQAGTATSPTVQFSSLSYNVAEGGLGKIITVTRTGDVSGVAAVDYVYSLTNFNCLVSQSRTVSVFGCIQVHEHFEPADE